MTNYTIVVFRDEETGWDGDIIESARFDIDVFTDVDEMTDRAAFYQSEGYDDVELLINGVKICDAEEILISADESIRIHEEIESKIKVAQEARRQKEEDERKARKLAEEARQRAIRRTEWERLNKEFGRS